MARSSVKDDPDPRDAALALLDDIARTARQDQVGTPHWMSPARRLLELHRPEETEFIDGDGDSRVSVDCASCDNGGVVDSWPCESVREIARVVGVEVRNLD